MHTIYVFEVCKYRCLISLILWQKETTIVRYRDLFEQFRYILEAEMKREKTDAPLVMSINAFRGFLDEFRKQEEARTRDNKKEDRRMDKKNMKREKHKKAADTIVSLCALKL